MIFAVAGVISINNCIEFRVLSIEIVCNKVPIVNNKTNNDTFTMTSDIDNSKVTITNSYSNTGFFDWVENKVNQLKTSNNI